MSIVTEQAQPTEQPVEQKQEVKTEVKAEQPQEQDLKIKLEEYAKHQKALLKQKAAIKAERERVEREKQEIESFKRQREQEERAKTQKMTPVEALQAAGYSYEDATQFVLNNNSLTPDMMYKKVEDKINAFMESQKKAQEQLELRQKEEMAKQQERVIADFKANIEETVKSNSEKYELINMHEAFEDVYELIDLYFAETGKVMKIDEAAELVEGELLERVEKSLAAKKLAEKFAKQEAKQQEQKKDTQQVTTLSNSLTSSVMPGANSGYSEEDRMKRALAALQR